MLNLLAVMFLTILTGVNQTGIDPFVPSTLGLTFTTYDSNSTSTHVQPTHIYVNNVETTFSYNSSTGVVTMDAPYTGNFTLKVTADNYSDFESNYTYKSLKGAAVNLVKIQTDTQSSSTLTWIHSAVSDLDSHMYTYNGTTQLSHVYYQKTSWSDDTTTVTTTKDDTGSGSGETTTIEPVNTSYSYQFWVYRYSGSGSMMTSEAKVVVTRHNISQTVTVPTGDEHRWWHVYDVINGEVVIVNTVHDAGP